MTLHEATALILLYRACGDESARYRALELVPDLKELVDDERQQLAKRVCECGTVTGRHDDLCPAGNHSGRRSVVEFVKFGPGNGSSR